MREVCLRQLQLEIGNWSQQQFGNNTSKATGFPTFSQNALTGLVEEVGELNHVTICWHQGRRGYDPLTNDGRDKYEKDRNDAIGDIMIFLLDYCHRENVDLQTVVNDTWYKVVSKRTVQNWEEHTHETKQIEQAKKDSVNASATLSTEPRVPSNAVDECERLGKLVSKALFRGWKLVPTNEHNGIFTKSEGDTKLRTIQLPNDISNHWAAEWKTIPMAFSQKEILYVRVPHWLERRMAEIESRAQTGQGFAEPAQLDDIPMEEIGAAKAKDTSVREPNNNYARDCSICHRVKVHTNNIPGVCSDCFPLYCKRLDIQHVKG